MATLGITVDVGPSALISELSRRIDDLCVVVEVGHRWGFGLARTVASWDLYYEIDRRGPEALEELFGPEWRRRRRSRRYMYEFLEFGPFFEDPEWITLLDRRAEGLIGQPVTVGRLQYQNPIELVLGGSGLLLLGVAMAARLVRDWSSTRRTNEAVAREAEAEARMTEDRARLYRWMVNEARRGDSPIPVGELVQIVTPAEVKSLARLSADAITLQLPQGTE